MGADDLNGCGCNGATVAERCGGVLPDNPDCGLNYHFGQLLGVEDFRAEQGFHVGRLRRHQRTLHGFGVVWGYGTSFEAEHAELRVEAGYALDARGRDLAMDEAQCLSLPAWWQKHRDEDEFADIANKDDASFDADVVLCHATCLARPVPAIADPCAAGTPEVAYSRLCESVKLTLVRRTGPPAAPPPPPYHLLRLLLGLDAVAKDEQGEPLPADAWLLAGLAALKAADPDQQPALAAALWQAAAARAAAASADTGAASADCLVIARLSGLHVFKDAEGWHAAVAAVSIDERPTLLPTGLLQEALGRLALTGGGSEAKSAPRRAVRAAAATARLSGSRIAIALGALAPASVTREAFAVAEFAADTGWSAIAVKGARYAAGQVELTLARRPRAALLRVTAVASGPTPLLAADLQPANGGQDLSITVTGDRHE